MKILYITTQPFVKDLDAGYLGDFAEPEDVTVRHNIEEAKGYLTGELVLMQWHIDFILLDCRGVEEEDADRFREWLERSSDSYSRGNLRVCAIPLILIQDESREGPGDNRVEWHKYMFFHGNAVFIKREVIGRAIDNWLHLIGDDLDHFDLDIQLQFDPKKIDWLLDHRSYRLKVLTELFFRRMQYPSYIWFGKNLQTFDVSLNQYADLLRQSERQPSRRNEKEIHAYLSANKRMFLGEFFEDCFYEKQLYLSGSRRYVEADFINVPYQYYEATQQIFEVKLPNERLVRTDKKVFYRRSVRAFEQVHLKYRSFFSSPANLQEIYRKTGYRSNKYTYTLLMGRRQEKEENLEYIRQYADQRDLRVVSYDELPEYFQRLYERTWRFSLT